MGGDSQLILNHTSYAILFTDMRRLLDYYPKGNKYRLALSILALTGMRCSELNKISINNFYENTIVWGLGKNQKGMRQVSLPTWFMHDLKLHLENNPHTEKRLFDFTSCSLRRKIHNLRPILGGNFLKKVHSRRHHNNGDYMISLKSFRHTYQCFLFWKFWKEYGSAEMAASLVSKEMKHSGTSFALTAKHYISSIHYIKNELERFGAWSYAEAIKPYGQTRLFRYN